MPSAQLWVRTQLWGTKMLGEQAAPSSSPSVHVSAMHLCLGLCGSMWVLGGLFLYAYVSALLSVSLVCLEMAVWVGESLCVSEP